MLYCKRAFLKRILKVDDVIHDILPCPFRMHNKSQPKVKTPSCTTGKADPRLLGREGAVLVFSCEVCRKRLQEWEELQSCWPDASSIQLELVYRAGPNRPSVGRWDRDASAPPVVGTEQGETHLGDVMGEVCVGDRHELAPFCMGLWAGMLGWEVQNCFGASWQAGDLVWDLIILPAASVSAGTSWV